MDLGAATLCRGLTLHDLSFQTQITGCCTYTVRLQFRLVQHARHAKAPKPWAYRADVAHYNSAPLHHCSEVESTETSQPDQRGRDRR